MTTHPRIVSLCPSNTEIVASLGLSEGLVGVDNYSDYPPHLVRNLPRLGPDLHIDMDKVQALKPDLVIASLSVPGMEKVVEALAATGLAYLVLSPHGFDEIYADMERVADAIGSTGMVEMNVRTRMEGLRQRVERVRGATSKLPVKPSLYWEWWPNPVFSPASNNWLTELSSLAGAQNIFADAPGDQVQDDGQRVLDAQPDYALMVWTGVPQHKVPLRKILSRPGWTDLPGFQEGRFFVLPEGLFCRPSPRLVDGLEQLVGLLHPQLALPLGLLPPHDYGPVRDVRGTWLGGNEPEQN